MHVDVFLEIATPPAAACGVDAAYAQALALARAADVAGFGAVWIAEHHFLGDYSNAAAPEMLLAAMAVLFAVVSVRVLQESLEYRSTAQTPWATPLILPQSFWYAGLAIFMLIAVGYAARATWLLLTRRLDDLNREFHPHSVKEELKDELEDLAKRQESERRAP